VTKTRLKVLGWWLKGIKNDVGLYDLLEYFFGASYKAKARAFVTKIAEEGDCSVLHLKGIESPLYYPKGMDIRVLEQVIVETFYSDNWHFYQTAETKVEPSDVVADCGAAEGLFSLVSSSVCKKIYAIEPLPRFIGSLRKTFATLRNVEILQCAVSDRCAEAFICEDAISSTLTDERNGTPVRVETIDHLFYDKDTLVTYLKIDLEGHDFAAIKGAEKTIKEYGPKIAVTTYHDEAHARQISDFIMQVDSRYRVRTRGIYQETGSPVMLHAWRG